MFEIAVKGSVAEWFKAAVLKTDPALPATMGFTHSLPVFPNAINASKGAGRCADFALLRGPEGFKSAQNTAQNVHPAFADFQSA